MRKTVLLSLLLAMGLSGWAQLPDSVPPAPETVPVVVHDTGQVVVHDTVPATLPSPIPEPEVEKPEPVAETKSGMNVPFALAVAGIIGAFIVLGAITYFNAGKKKKNSRMNNQVEETMPEESASEPLMSQPAEEPKPVIPETVVVAEPPPVAAPLPVEESAATTPEEAPPQPEVFYMTVPGTDGSFAAGAKKSNPSGCLYKFVVAPEKPDDAEIFFAGNETDMRNAQAFRDLELLPVCTFSGMPDTNTFRFTQLPGRAVFDGNAWQVKIKIAITFV